MLEEPMADGPPKGKVIPPDKMLPEHYKLRGWTAMECLPNEIKRTGSGLIG